MHENARHNAPLQDYDVIMFIDADAVVLGDLQAIISLLLQRFLHRPIPLSCPLITLATISLLSLVTRLFVPLSTFGCRCSSTLASWCSGPTPRCVHPAIAARPNSIPLNALPQCSTLQLYRELLAAAPSLPPEEAEQSALNEYFHGRWQPLPYVFNFQKHPGTSPSRLAL